MPDNPYYKSRHWRSLRAERLQFDQHQCCVAGCRVAASVVDHVRTRPRVPYPTAADCLSNLRSLCEVHDRQVKERADGTRRSSGAFKVRGCDADGIPYDPAFNVP